jgi:hypothetical protein
MGMKDNIEYIRRWYKVPVKRNQIVSYDGRIYRVANIPDGSTLLLRWEVRVHPTDPGLKFPDTEEGIKQQSSWHEKYKWLRENLGAKISEDHEHLTLTMADGSCVFVILYSSDNPLRDLVELAYKRWSNVG